MKILVTGNAGSGKSTLSKLIADGLRVPLASLDKIVWQEGWKKTPPEQRADQIELLISKKDWIIDGVSYEVQSAADIIVFLDMPRRVCFWQAGRRNSRHLFSSRPELPAHCPEILIIPTLLKIIWRFPSRVKPFILAEKQKRDVSAFIHITSKLDREHFLKDTLPALISPK